MDERDVVGHEKRCEREKNVSVTTVERKKEASPTTKVGHKLTLISFLLPIIHHQLPLFLILHKPIRTDYVSGGELFTHLYQRDHFSEAEVRIYIGEIILALENLHKLGIIYRDIKLENILLDSEGHIVLTDFGLSKDFSPHETDLRTFSFCGTIEYMAPEVVRGGSTGHNFSVDWWSIGVLTYELLTGASPFTVEGERNTQAEISRRILKSHPPIPEFMSPAVQDFIKRLLVKDSKRRLGGGPDDALELKRHPFFRGLDWEALSNKQIPAPFVPRITGELDVSNFAEEFTSMLPVDPETPNTTQDWDDSLFRDYSYVSPSLASSDDESEEEQVSREPRCLRRRIALTPNDNRVNLIRRDQTQNHNPVAAQLKPEVSHIMAAKYSSSSFFSDYELKLKNGFLGDGSFSVCRECVHKESGVSYAVKIISRRIDSSREINMLKQCQGHPNIVNIIDTRQDDFHTYIILELLKGGELVERLRKRPFNEQEAGQVFRGLLSAVHFMHSKGIVHRDLKPEVRQRILQQNQKF